MCPRRTTGFAVTWRCTSGSRRAATGWRWWTWPAARATAAPRSPAAPRGSPGWTPTRRPTRTPRPSTRGRASASCATWSTATPQPCDAVVFLQTIEHVEQPEAVLRHFKEMLRPGGTAYVSTPNVLTLAPGGGGEVRQPVAPQGVQGRGVRRAVPRRLRRGGAARPLPRPQAARCTSSRCSAGWDSLHPALGVTKPFYDRFTPAISARDFALRPGPLHRALDFVAVLR